MNRFAMPKPRLRVFASLAALALIAGCGEPAPQAPPLEGAAIGGPFTLLDGDGKTVRWSDFDGKWRMVYFGYAYCPDVCPFDVQRMMQGYAAFAAQDPDRAAKIVPIFITVDPERDTPAVVKEFTSAFSDDLIGLTGTPEQVREAATNFSVYYEKSEETDAGGYMMDHSRGAYLLDPQGKPIALLPVDEAAQGVTEVLDQWVN